MITVEQFEQILKERNEQPAWRSSADREYDYYDGNQLDASILQRQRELGIPPAIEPVIASEINLMLGLEVKQRADWRVISESDGGSDDVADALNWRLNQAEKQSQADRACSDSFKSMLITGLGWAEVSREHDPFLYPYRVKPVHRNEIYWDWFSSESSLDDARWLLRQRWVDVDQAEAMFPDKKRILQSLVGAGLLLYRPEDCGEGTGLAMRLDQERGWTIEEQEWLDRDRKRICLSELWYRTWDRGHVIKTPDGRVVEFDKKNALHQAALKMGADVKETMLVRVRVAWFCGPHKLSDNPSPYRHNHFPYVPFWCFREDRTRVPYGWVRGMLYLQDEINARISKMQWLLSSRRVIRTDGIVQDTDEGFRQMAARPDADIVLNPDAAAKSGARFEIDSNQELNRQQYERLQDARAAIKRVTGITESFSGRSDRGVTSGSMANSLIEQSVQAVTDVLDNFKAGREMVGELLLSLIIEDLDGIETSVNVPGGVLADDRQVLLNVPTIDEITGQEYRDNDVTRTRLKVALADVPSTPTFRAQQLAAMSESFKAMPQRYQEATLPFLLNLMDVPDKEEVLDVVKQLAKVPTEEEVQQRIDEGIAKSGIEVRMKDAETKAALADAQIKKIVAESVAKTIEAIYSATQAGVQISQVPQVAGIADQLLNSAGFQDQDMPPIVAEPQGIPVADPAMPPGVEQNTSPMYPPRASPEGIEQPMVETIELNSPAAGMGAGIESLRE